MEEDDWEEFVLEWVDFLRKNQAYTEVHRCGSKGDMGRDVIGFNRALKKGHRTKSFLSLIFSRKLLERSE
jgi:hypothetical protein